MDLQELIQRLRAGESRSAISRTMQISVNTVKRYRHWAQAQGLLAGPLPDLATLEKLRQATYRSSPATGESSLEAYRAEVTELMTHGRQPRAIWNILRQRHPAEFSGSPSAVWRLTQTITASLPKEVVLRLETEPGEVAQVDFGYMGSVLDPDTRTPRKGWAFTMVLAWSRHQYAELVYDQKLATWLLCHQHAFEFFGGVPKRVVLDNLKAAIIHAYTVEQEAVVQDSYRYCAVHYGFLIDPCLPNHPQHKGKVERGGVGYLKQSFAPLLTAEDTLTTANQKLQQWLLTTAGLRVHGTTREVPLARFEQTERAALLPLPSRAYDPLIQRPCTVHRDCHLVIDKSYYSVPHRLVGQTVTAGVGLKNVYIFDPNYQLVATHPRAQQPGERFTQPDHLPPQLAEALQLNRQTCQARAEAIGSATAQVVAELLASRPVDRFRTAVRVLKLADKFTAARLEAACVLGLAQGDPGYCHLKRLLDTGLETQPPLPSPSPPLTDQDLVFARTPTELAAAILGGAACN